VYCSSSYWLALTGERASHQPALPPVLKSNCPQSGFASRMRILPQGGSKTLNNSTEKCRELFKSGVLRTLPEDSSSQNVFPAFTD